VTSARRTVRVEGSADTVGHAYAHARSPRAAEQERRALRDWAPRLSLLRTPRMLAPQPEDDPLVIRTDWLDGDRLDTRDWRGEPSLARRLGEGLAELHALPFVDDDLLPLGEALRRRLDGWLARGADALVDQGDALRRVVAGALDGARRVPCHRDVGPENVLLGERLGLIDWEHARPDHPWTDALRTWEGLSPRDDPWLAALAEGMGRDPGEEWATLRALGVIEGAGCVVWGETQREPLLVDRGWQLLERLTAARRPVHDPCATE